MDHTAPLYFAAPNQVNLLIPSEVPLGPVRITVTNSNGDTFPIVTAATGTSPGLFAANADGRGIAAAQVIRVFKDGSQSVENVAKLDPAKSLSFRRPSALEASNCSDALWHRPPPHPRSEQRNPHH